MTKINNYSTASTDPAIVLMSYLDAKQKNGTDYDFAIKFSKNENWSHPIKELNPLLNDMNNWCCSHGILRTDLNLKEALRMNEHPVAQEIIRNYTNVYFESKEAVEVYKKTGVITGNTGMGFPHLVHWDHFLTYRPDYAPKSSQCFISIPEPKKGIDLYIPSKGLSFAVVHSPKGSGDKTDWKIFKNI